MNTYARPVRDLRNNYSEIISLANEDMELAKAKEKAKDPTTEWLGEEEFWAGVEEGL